MWRIPPPPQPSTPSWQALRQLFTNRKIGISRNPTKTAAGPGGAENGRCSRELERREGHLVAAESWGDRASDRLGRRRCRWLDVGAPRQHPRAVCSGLSCAAPTSPAILFLRRDQERCATGSPSSCSRGPARCLGLLSWSRRPPCASMRSRCCSTSPLLGRGARAGCAREEDAQAAVGGGACRAPPAR